MNDSTDKKPAYKNLVNIQKRNGRLVPFEFDKLVNVVFKSMLNSGEGSSYDSETVAHKVARALSKLVRESKVVPTVEGCQDEVERQLMLAGFTETAKHYILYRNERAAIREKTGEVPAHVRALAEESAKYFVDNPMGEFVYLRSYSRWIESEGRRETWVETVDRYMDFMRENLGDKLREDEYAELRQSILIQEVMPSMRAMQFAGEAARRCHSCLYNCGYDAPKTLRDFAETLYLSMMGVGVGWSAESYNVQHLPQIKHQSGDIPTVHVVEDSKEGWADALIVGLMAWYNGHDIDFKYHLVRNAGARLKTMGGRASGPEPLRALLKFTRAKILAQQGCRLRNIDAHDVQCMTGECAVAGGVRRTAMIGLSDLNDRDIRDAKVGQFWITDNHRRVANDSAVYSRKPTSSELLEEWCALIKSGTGERGIFNRQAVVATMPARRRAFLKKKYGKRFMQIGTNPCGEIALQPKEFCVAGDTPMITSNGVFNIESLRGKSVDVWNGNEWTPVTVRRTAKNIKIVRVTLSDGSYLDVTPEHKFSAKHRFQKEWGEVAAKDLLGGKYTLQLEPTTIAHPGKLILNDAYSVGFAVGDGHAVGQFVNVVLYGDKIECPVTGTRGEVRRTTGYNVDSVPVMLPRSVSADSIACLKTSASGILNLHKYSRDSILSFVAGLADSDGSETGTGGIRIYLSQEDRARALQLILTSCGIRSSVNLMAAAGEETNLCVRKQDMWYLQITDCCDIPCSRLDTSRGHNPRFKGKYQNVQSIQNLPGRYDVFCFNEPKKHKAVFGNVLTHQCNLSEVIGRHNDTVESLMCKQRLSVILGTYQSTLTNFNFISPEWKKNCEDERLLGASVTGQWDCPAFRDSDVMLGMLRLAIATNIEYAERFGINPSLAITAVKPSGTVSQTFNCSSGMHARYAPYYIRRIRISATDSLFKLMRDQGVPYNPEVGQTMEDATTFVIDFPVKSPEGARCRNDFTALEQLEYWKMVKLNYTEHNPSITVSVGDDEWIGVVNWLDVNWDIAGGLAFLPRDNHVYQLAPYEEIDEATYTRLAAEFPKVDYAKLCLYEKVDETDNKRELACSGTSCEMN